MKEMIKDTREITPIIDRNIEYKPRAALSSLTDRWRGTEFRPATLDKMRQYINYSITNVYSQSSSLGGDPSYSGHVRILA